MDKKLKVDTHVMQTSNVTATLKCPSDVKPNKPKKSKLDHLLTPYVLKNLASVSGEHCTKKEICEKTHTTRSGKELKGYCIESKGKDKGVKLVEIRPKKHVCCCKYLLQIDALMPKVESSFLYGVLGGIITKQFIHKERKLTKAVIGKLQCHLSTLNELNG